MKRVFVLGALAAVVLTQAGCATDVKSVPLAAAGGQSRGGVPVYFGEQSHPAVTARLGEVSYSVRIARKVALAPGVSWAEAQPDQGATFYFTLEGNESHDGSHR